MGHHDDRIFSLFQHFFQPFRHVAVQVVGGLVQNQQVGWRKQHADQRQTLFLSAGQMPACFVKIRYSQPGHHILGIGDQVSYVSVCHLLTGLQCHTFAVIRKQCTGFSVKFPVFPKQCLYQRILRPERRMLGQKTDHHALRPDDLALVRLFHAYQNFKQRAFAGAVNADDTDFFPFLQKEGGSV